MSEITLRRHRMAHLGDLRVDPKVLTARFDHRCATARCSGRCCITGVWADAAERDAILRHADVVQTHMDGAQEHDPSRWFETDAWDHADFPSGRGFGTAVSGGGCVFLRADRRCALQRASDAQTGALKPLFCSAFPLMSSTARCASTIRATPRAARPPQTVPSPLLNCLPRSCGACWARMASRSCGVASERTTRNGWRSSTDHRCGRRG